MNIEIRDSALEARIQRQIQTTGATSPEEALLHLLDTQEERIVGCSNLKMLPIVFDL